MKWRVLFRPEVEQDVAKAAKWYDRRQSGLGNEFREEVIQVFDELEFNPLLYCRRRGTTVIGNGAFATKSKLLRALCVLCG